MSGRPRYTQEQVIRALTQAGGLKTPACQALHCTRFTLNSYIRRYPAVKEAYEDALEGSLDVAQSKLMVLVEREDWRAIRYMLSTLGKHRGFTERQEVVTVGDDREALRQQFLDDVRRVYGDEDEEEDEDE